jgi:hypothetical protein
LRTGGGQGPFRDYVVPPVVGEEKTETEDYDRGRFVFYPSAAVPKCSSQVGWPIRAPLEAEEFASNSVPDSPSSNSNTSQVSHAAANPLATSS